MLLRSLNVRRPLLTKQGPSISLMGCSAKVLRAGDLAGLHALGADVGLADMALGVLDGDLLDVGTEPTVRHAVGMADVTTGNGALTADFAFCHYAAPPLPLKMQYYYSQY